MPGKNRTFKGVLGGVLGFTALSALAGLLLTATITPAIALTSTAASSAISVFNNIPGFLAIDKLMLPTEIYATNKQTGQPQLMAQFWEQNRQPVTYDQVSPYIVDSLLSSEDPRYFEHGGIDMIGTARALLSNAAGGGETQGGSSITQQYVKNVLIQRCEAEKETQEEKDACWTEATNAEGAEGYKRKVQELRYAIALEQRFSKEEILLGYLNIANFGGRTYGIEAAAQRYFGVSAANVTLDQAAILAGMVQNPNSFRIDHPEWEMNGEATNYQETKHRRNYVLGRLLDDKKITEADYDAAYALPITPNIQAESSGCVTAVDAEYFCQMIKIKVLNDPAFGETAEERRLMLDRGGLKIYTTMDWDLQWNNMRTMESTVPATVEGIANFGSAIVNVEVGTGRVLSMVQNTHFSEASADAGTPGYTSLVYGADQRYGLGTGIGFPAGSTFKVFTVLEWLKEGHSIREVLNGVNRKAWTVGCGTDKIKFDPEKMVQNYNGVRGYTGDIVRFTRDSLNSGFFAMAEKLDMCKIGQTAMDLGVYNGNYWTGSVQNEAGETATGYLKADGTPNYLLDENGERVLDEAGFPVTEPDALTPIDMTTGHFSVLGSHNVSPLAMANAYATIAAGGTYCEPRFIDRVTDSDGKDRPDLLPVTTCTPGVISPEVAATAIVPLSAVMNDGAGTGRQANNWDGVPVFGKTGTHEEFQTWMVQSSSKVATAAWVGNSEGESDMTWIWLDSGKLTDLRYKLSRESQGVANSVFGGAAFPQPDPNLSRQVYKDLPNVVGMSIADAEKALEDAGFAVTVGPEIPGSQPAGIIEQQDPGAGSVVAGTTVTISPSNGQGGAVPDVMGMSVKNAKSTLINAGFTSIQESCVEKDDAPKEGTVTAQSPGSGTVTTKQTPVSITYEREKCK
ncbi:transglycosylase domain-containing protein [Microbacterium sp. NC79]|uniref:transglycosylase domain-containing protein n=1 Tax=Microbacterium sp. NC79 TaxID=2851009 RepID=UPI001C2CBF82|nr:transglycosylase domain-containing protein [Microbacterium sp. NC79]MBV0895514.1 transglycosylase domain-containing protein [Microbacterium sp. NC79]